MKIKLDAIIDETKKDLIKTKKRRSFIDAIKNKSHISLIAEIKRASPSLGDINVGVDIVEQAKTYEQGGASTISVLTNKHFKGSMGDLVQIKAATNIPILRKDFIFDPYQVYESYYCGTDAILLIATILDLPTLRKLLGLAHDLGMECLVEVHDEKDLAKALATDSKIIGINARNLKTFEVDLGTVVDLAQQVPRDRFIVAESGIESAVDVRKVAIAGAQAILVGTTLMKANNVSQKIHELQITKN